MPFDFSEPPPANPLTRGHGPLHHQFNFPQSIRAGGRRTDKAERPYARWSDDEVSVCADALQHCIQMDPDKAEAADMLALIDRFFGDFGRNASQIGRKLGPIQRAAEMIHAQAGQQLATANAQINVVNQQVHTLQATNAAIMQQLTDAQALAIKAGLPDLAALVQRLQDNTDDLADLNGENANLQAQVRQLTQNLQIQSNAMAGVQAMLNVSNMAITGNSNAQSMMLAGFPQMQQQMHLMLGNPAGPQVALQPAP